MAINKALFSSETGMWDTHASLMVEFPQVLGLGWECALCGALHETHRECENCCGVPGGYVFRVRSRVVGQYDVKMTENHTEEDRHVSFQ